MKIDCLMGTYGRFHQACEALSSFLQQSALKHATLLIYNQHPTPLSFEHPRVRVINEPRTGIALRDIRQRMFELSDPAADLIHFWDDDDLYLPWHLEDCLARIGDSQAWKPAKSWYSWSATGFDLVQNFFEGSWVFRREFVARSRLDAYPTYIDHPVFLQAISDGRLRISEIRASYVYRWHLGWTHLAAFGGSNLLHLQVGTMSEIQRRNCDMPDDGTMIPADLTEFWNDYLSAIRTKLSSREWMACKRGIERTQD